MSPEFIAIVIAAVVIGFPWDLHRDVDDLREQMARFEALFERFTRRVPIRLTRRSCAIRRV